MPKNQRQTPRKPATKFVHLQKKMQKQKVQVKKPTGKKNNDATSRMATNYCGY